MHKKWRWGTCGLLVIALCGCKDRAAPKPEPKPEIDRAALAPVDPSAPQDRPLRMTGEGVEAMERAIQPYVEQAKQTYPEAKRRYLAGLPPGERFHVVTKLRRPGGFEHAFIEVTKIEGDQITGIIATDLQPSTPYKAGDSYTLPEPDLHDWLIVRADGTEEGNVVGKFLDHWKAPQ